MSITEVALQSGFTSLSAFNRMFKLLSPVHLQNIDVCIPRMISNTIDHSMH